METSYTVTIKRTTRCVVESTENFVTHEEPTDKVKDGYGSRPEPVMMRDFAPIQKRETREKDEKVYEHTVTGLNVPAVIRSVLEHSDVEEARGSTQ